MKKILISVICFIGGMNLFVTLTNDATSKYDINLKALNTAFAETSEKATFTCKCVVCKGSEECLPYNYDSDAGKKPSEGTMNDGYNHGSGSNCESEGFGAGYVEQRAIDVFPDYCD